MQDHPDLRLRRAVVVSVSPRTLLRDAALAAGLCVLDLVISWEPNGTRWDPYVPLFAALGYAALVVRQRYPRTVFVLVFVHCLIGWTLVPAYVPTLGLLLALYTIASRSGRVLADAALLAMVVPTVLTAVSETRAAEAPDKTDALLVSSVLSTLLTLAVFATGRWVAWSRRQREIAAERAAVEAVDAERRRIARDLHDVVAHTVTMMMLQSTGAARVLRVDQERAETALEAVGALGQQAVVELRRMLAVLAPSDVESPAASAPVGINDVPVLVEQVRRSGREVLFEVDGEPVPHDPGVGLCAYRIVQEALTNATRYGHPERPISVRLSWTDAGIDLAIRNDLASAAGPRAWSAGRGVLGMRERAASVSGRLTAGPDGDGGYLVTVALPVLRAVASTLSRP